MSSFVGGDDDDYEQDAHHIGGTAGGNAFIGDDDMDGAGDGSPSMGGEGASSSSAAAAAGAAAANGGGGSGFDSAAEQEAALAEAARLRAEQEAAALRPEDASRLHFGPALARVEAEFLTNTEAAIVLKALADKAASTGREKTSDTFLRSREYAAAFGLGSKGEAEDARAAADELRTQLLDRTFASGASTELPGGALGDRLHKFEVASLGNLRPSDAAAARMLVPSLARFDDADVRTMLITVARCVGRLDGE